MKPLLILLFLAAHATGQAVAQDRPEGLVAKLSSTKGDTAKVWLLQSIFLAYRGSNLDSALFYADLGLVVARRISWKRAIGVFHSDKGENYNSMGKYDAALREFDTALTISRVLKDTTNEAVTVNDIGCAYMDQSRNKEAAPYFFQSVALSEAKGNDRLAAVGYMNIGNIYFDQQDNARAIRYTNLSLNLYSKLKDTAGIASAYKSLADIYLVEKDTVTARADYARAIPLFEKTDDEINLAMAYSNQAILYVTDIYSRLLGELKAQAIWDRVSPLHRISIVNTGNIGIAYLDVVRSDTFHRVPRGGLVPLDTKDILRKSDAYFAKAISMSRQVGDSASVAYITGVLAESQAFRGDYKDAYLNYHRYQDEQDSLFSQDSKNKLASLEEQHEVSLRDKQIQIGKLALLAERRWRLTLVVGLCLLSVIGVLLYFQSRSKSRTNTRLRQLNTELAAAERIKAKFFAILSHDLRSPITSFINFLHLQREKPDLMDARKTASHQQKIADYAEDLLGTMEAMLLWSKGQMEDFTPELRTVPVRELFRHLEIFFAGQEETLHFSDPGELSLVTDDNYLKTILHNLTANALRAVQQMPAGRVTWRAFAGERAFSLEIRDNGQGMTSAQLRALEDDRPVSHANRGFGLHIVRDLARAIHCSITVHSEPGKGTRFLLEFSA